MPAFTAVWAERAEARLSALRQVVVTLAAMHRSVVDRTDIDLDAQTRWAAIVHSTARCISLADALIDQLWRGYTSETAGTARVLHEALELAVALSVGDED